MRALIPPSEVLPSSRTCPTPGRSVLSRCQEDYSRHRLPAITQQLMYRPPSHQAHKLTTVTQPSCGWSSYLATAMPRQWCLNFGTLGWRNVTKKMARLQHRPFEASRAPWLWCISLYIYVYISCPDCNTTSSCTA